MEKPIEIEIDGNYIGINDDTITVRLSRENELNGAVRVYADYVLSKSELPYNKWLDEELKKEIEKRLTKELSDEKDKA